MATPDIEHVVVLMLENRSFDSLLGWLYQQQAPSQFLPPGSKPTYDGLQSIDLAAFTNTAGQLSSPPIRGAQGFTVPTVDPGEEFAHVTQQFFNSPAYPPVTPANMLGYLQDFVNVMQAMGVGAGDIPRLAPEVMQSYTPDQLPVLNQLAQAYAVSDAWYASVPSQTNPNRAFLMCGTSLGAINNGQLEIDAQAKAIEKLLGMAIGDDRFDAPTIFNAVDAGGKDWAVFWQTSYLPQKISTLLADAQDLALALTFLSPPLGLAILAALALLEPYIDYLTGLTDGSLGSCYTWRLFPQIQGLPNAAQKFQPLEQFHALAQAGRLPAFSYIEPFWSISQVTTPTLSQLPKALITALGSDYHPPSNLLVGEELVKAVYASLVSNPAAWEKTVLLITFDEFVGVFDHEVDGLQQGKVAPPWGAGTPPPLAQHNDFYFDRLGGRVPTIVVSPWVQAGTVFRSPSATPYDHTSAIATALKFLGLSKETGLFGARTAAAPTFDGVLTLATPRTDAADLPFMDRPRASGDPVNYGDSLLLQNQNGSYLTAFEAAPLRYPPGMPTPSAGVLGMLCDLDLAARFPTLGQGAPAPVSFVGLGPDKASGPLPDGAQVYLVSREPGLMAHNALGAWSGAADCYYFVPYLEGDADYPNQLWTIQNRSHPGAAIRYGDDVVLWNAAWSQGLSQDDRVFEGRWITTRNPSDTWTVTPAPVTLPS